MRELDKMDELVGILSPLGRMALELDADKAYRRLVVTGAGDARAAEMLRGVAAGELLARSVVNANEAAGVLSALWLRHDWLDESHTIAQGIERATGSFWHAIMHRREGDFSNSKYWYARCRNHPALTDLARIAAASETAAGRRVTAGGWNPDALVDLAEAAHRGDDAAMPAAIALQRLEWRVLFERTVRAAVGA